LRPHRVCAADEPESETPAGATESGIVESALPGVPAPDSCQAFTITRVEHRRAEDLPTRQGEDSHQHQMGRCRPDIGSVAVASAHGQVSPCAISIASNEGA
jgi:hypothetical protein